MSEKIVEALPVREGQSPSPTHHQEIHRTPCKNPVIAKPVYTLASQSVLPCGDNFFGAPHSLYRTGRTESSAPTSHSVGATLAVARPTAFLETIRRGRRPRRPVCTVLHALTPPHTPPPRKRADAPQASVLPNSAKIICYYTPECPGPAGPWLAPDPPA